MITITIEAETTEDLRLQLAGLLGIDTPEPEKKAGPKKPQPKASGPKKPQPKAAKLEAVEPAPEPEPAPIEGEVLEAGEVTLNVDDLRKRFEQLVIDDYDKAEALIDELGVDNFSQAIGAGKEQEVADALAAYA